MQPLQHASLSEHSLILMNRCTLPGHQQRLLVSFYRSEKYTTPLHEVQFLPFVPRHLNSAHDAATMRQPWCLADLLVFQSSALAVVNVLFLSSPLFFHGR